ncbi:potassium channel family protein [Lactobacillus sp. Sy-1]|uniref:potassium channel family protein n=1 Tax=Lactobacillus sp. Sy-1 TaxID=2109645 RepID=UPI00351D649F
MAIVILALASIVMVILDYLHIIYLYRGWLMVIYYGVWITFILDYIINLIFSHNKRRFLISTCLDLVSLIPGHPVFVFFRIYRVIRIIRGYHIFWHLGWDGKVTKKIHQFIYDTGFIYIFSVSIIILIIAALIFSHFEHYPLKTAMWWAITTATTVGYGDIAPQTAGGRLDAAVLMIGGVGFIGLLTSSITDFFTKNNAENEGTSDKLDRLMEQVELLNKEVHSMRQELDQAKKNAPKDPKRPKKRKSN